MAILPAPPKPSKMAKSQTMMPVSSTTPIGEPAPSTPQPGDVASREMASPASDVTPIKFSGSSVVLSRLLVASEEQLKVRRNRLVRLKQRFSAFNRLVFYPF